MAKAKQKREPPDENVSLSVPTRGAKAGRANTPALVTDAGNVLAANASRKAWAVVNCGQNPLFVRLGASASSTVFHFVLKGCTGNDDGSGGAITDEIYTGIVSIAGTNPRCVVTEL